ncbi:MAG: NAD(P)/FAD-dependent oxidoreductase [Rhodobacteraceae bacterium]|nr:NAD(P)/FAD-dependent oxidoreductase [Paracoccaceae bacterium]
MPDESFDLAIIGAGPAGSVCANSALAEFPDMRVAIVDRETFPRDKACGDAIRYDAVSKLKDLGLDAVFEGRRLIDNIQPAFPPRFQFLDQLFAHNAQSRAGCNSFHIVERRVFDNYLCKAALRAGAEDFTGFSLTDARSSQSGQGWILTLKHNSGRTREVVCGVLVGADGAGSRVRRIAGLKRNQDKHTALGLRAYANAPGIAENCMRFDYLENFFPGYGWVFPLTGDRVNVGVGIHKIELKSCKRSLKSLLGEYFAYLRQTGIQVADPLPSDIKSFPLPLASQTLELVPKPRLALVGDAAAMIDPFTGEGIQFGIWAGDMLGCSVARSLRDGGDPQVGLESYAEAYAAHFGEVIAFSKNLSARLRLINIFS